MNPEIISKEPVSIVEMKSIISSIKKRDGELNFRAGRTEEYLNDFALLKITKARELMKKLQDLNLPRLKDQHIKKIVDVMPFNEKHLKIILSGYTITVKNDDLKKIMAVVNDYRE